MRVFVGYESSGVVRDAFRRLGHDAWSCDLQVSDDGSEFHLHGDVWNFIHQDWDLRILHPSCTFLTCSAEWAYGDGPYHQKVKPETLVGADRRAARSAALQEVRKLMSIGGKMCIENPVGVISREIRRPTQTIQPHQFGDDASKRTCLWLNGLLPLEPTDHVVPRMVDGRPRWANQTDSGQNKLSPSADRWKNRSKTYQGIANAMAAQWGGRL